MTQIIEVIKLNLRSTGSVFSNRKEAMVMLNSVVIVRTRHHYVVGVVVGETRGRIFEVEIHSNGNPEGDYKGLRRQCFEEELAFLGVAEEGEEINLQKALELANAISDINPEDNEYVVVQKALELAFNNSKNNQELAILMAH